MHFLGNLIWSPQHIWSPQLWPPLLVVRSFEIIVSLAAIITFGHSHLSAQEIVSKTPTSSPANALADRAAKILATRCLQCHEGAEAEAHLDLSSQQSVNAGSDSGNALDGYEEDRSLLWTRVASDEMPPKKSLLTEEKDILREWLRLGAPWPQRPLDRFEHSTDERAGRDWWSLQPLRDDPPPVANTADHPIDSFITARLSQSKLQLAPRATPRELVRRLYFDMLGLPPPLGAIEDFAQDPSQIRWEQLIDKVLQSPHYGERWGQHWLDIVRFGESEGFEYNQPRTDAWHYRDWIIRALNDDLPYDRFSAMQIAGDLLAPDSLDGIAATGMLVAGPHNTVLGNSEVMKATVRHQELEEIAGTLSQTFLGLTIHCARCHDHKFDPIKSEEYYRFISSLDGVTHGVRNWQDPAQIIAQTSNQQRSSAIYREWSRLSASLFRVPSQTANTLQTRLPPSTNIPSQIFTLSLSISPTVWADASQATAQGDGLWIRIANSQGKSFLDEFVLIPSWNEVGSKHAFNDYSFSYQGDDSGELQLWIGAGQSNGRFGGAIDSITITNRDGTITFRETFDQINPNSKKGLQANTSLPVYFGLSIEGWISRGLNAPHAAELSSGHWAIQLYGGELDQPISNENSQQHLLIEELAAMHSHTVDKPIFSVVPRASGAMKRLKRGDVQSPAEIVTPGGLSAITSINSDFQLAADAPERDRRLSLANWITHRENGPFHRSIVNRVWHYHFGQGLVQQPNDVGFQGGSPSHPELLDWLAGYLRNHNYSLKRLHRLILTSNTYQQSSHSSDIPGADKAMAIDKDNRLLWRQNPRRLDGETIRDSMLIAAGTLDRSMYGPGLRDVSIETIGAAHYYPYNESLDLAMNRRTIYRWRVRGDRSSILDGYDCPDPSASAPRRSSTTTATQSLTHWNHPQVLSIASTISRQVEQQITAGDSPSATESMRIARVWERILGRTATQQEIDVALPLVKEHGLTLLCRVLLNSNENVVVD